MTGQIKSQQCRAAVVTEIPVVEPANPALHQVAHLPITNPPPAPRETVYSYLSRLAATWQTDVSDLAYDMGAPFRHFIEQDPEAFDTLTSWAGLDPDQMEELLSWTGLRAGNQRMSFRGELLTSRALRNPVMRGCPACLREDAAQGEGPSAAAMVMRGDWQMREMHICVRHRHALVPLWTSREPRARYDVGTRLREIEDDILSGALDQPEVPVTAYDLWLDRRLGEGVDETLFKETPLFAATIFCKLLGQVLFGEDSANGKSAHQPGHAAAFDIARLGKDAIRQAFHDIAAAATGHLDEPNKAFGALYVAFNREYAEEEGLAPFKALLRECILDHWPIAPGQVLLGEPVTERRVHSIVTAARECGVGADLIEQFLLEAGALRDQSGRPRSRQIFDAQTYAGLLAEIPSLVGPNDMRRAMGATRQELPALEKAGLLVPRTRIAKVKYPWRLSDGTAFVAELLAGAVPVAADDIAWETLLLASRRTKASLSDLVHAVRDGRIPVGQREGIAGFHGLVVSKKDADDLAASCPAPAPSNEVELPGVMSAAKFGRSVGLRDGGSFIALVKAGYTPAERYLNPKTGRDQYRVSAEDIAAFHGRFVTLTTLSGETGLHRNNLKTRFARSRVMRFSPDGQNFGPVYLRSEASEALE